MDAVWGGKRQPRVSIASIACQDSIVCQPRSARTLLAGGGELDWSSVLALQDDGPEFDDHSVGRNFMSEAIVPASTAHMFPRKAYGH